MDRDKGADDTSAQAVGEFQVSVVHGATVRLTSADGLEVDITGEESPHLIEIRFPDGHDMTLEGSYDWTVEGLFYVELLDYSFDRYDEASRRAAQLTSRVEQAARDARTGLLYCSDWHDRLVPASLQLFIATLACFIYDGRPGVPPDFSCGGELLEGARVLFPPDCHEPEPPSAPPGAYASDPPA